MQASSLPAGRKTNFSFRLSPPSNIDPLAFVSLRTAKVLNLQLDRVH